MGAFRAHLLKGANYTSSIKQILLYQRSRILDRKVSKARAHSKLAFNFFFLKVVTFVLVVTASAVPFLYIYAIGSRGGSQGQSLPTAQHPLLVSPSNGVNPHVN